MKQILYSLFLFTFAMNTLALDISKGKCFILYNLNTNKMVSTQGGSFCKKRITTDSTFKVALSLMAFDQRIVNENTVFKWDGKKRALALWNRDQTPKSWLRYSVVWVSQTITPRLGMKKIKYYLQLFHYGNQDFSGDPRLHNGLSHAWLSSSLKISPIEQVKFLKALIDKKLPVSNQAMTHTLHNLYLKTLKDGFKLYGKTGAGLTTINKKLRSGWFVGYLIKNHTKFIMVSDLVDHKVSEEFSGGVVAKQRALQKIKKLNLM